MNLVPKLFLQFCVYSFITPDRRQSKTIDELGSKIAGSSVFDCHLSPVGRQMAIENCVANDFNIRSTIVLTFSITSYPVHGKNVPEQYLMTKVLPVLLSRALARGFLDVSME